MERFVALLIDLAFMLVWYFVSMIIAKSFGPRTLFDVLNSDSYLYMMMIFSFIFFPALFFYNLCFEIFAGGASLGKKIMGIKVVNLAGQNPNVSECFLRWVMRPVELALTLGSLAAIFVSSSEKSQRIGDMIARTVVIKLRPSLKYSLKDVLAIKTSNDYTPKHLTVTRFSEDEMLYVKNIADRSRRYPNDANRKLLNEITIKICSQLNIKEIPESRKQVDFLKSLIQDYVVLTRS